MAKMLPIIKIPNFSNICEAIEIFSEIFTWHRVVKPEKSRLVDLTPFTNEPLVMLLLLFLRCSPAENLNTLPYTKFSGARWLWSTFYREL